MKFSRLFKIIAKLLILGVIVIWFIFKMEPDISKESEYLSALDSLSSIALKNGKEEMAKHKIIIAGITRDNIPDILTTIKDVEYIGEFFKDYRVILFENDSIDGTKFALETWQQVNSKVRIISKDFLNKKRPSHKFMADARNHYLEALKNQEYSDFDLLMVLDMDMPYGIDIRGIEESFNKINTWDAVCSNGILNQEGNMYDAFAFRNNEFPWTLSQWQEICSKNDPSNPWSKICKQGKAYSKGELLDNLSFQIGWHKKNRLYWQLIMPQIQKIYPVNSDLVPVTSCFGGMAFYKISFIKDCEYDSVENDCEHIAFHQCLKDNHNGKMFLNPNLIIRYSRD